MPRYDYGCGTCGKFEAFGSVNDSEAPCPVCHKPARRRPFSGVPNLKGETVSKSIPDPVYRQEAEARELHASWGTAERSIEMIRKARVWDAEGRMAIDGTKLQ